MENRLFATLESGVPDASSATDPLLKTTSLLYLKDALQRERYEECAVLIQNAKGFGASTREISDVLTKYVRYLSLGRNGANVKGIRKFS